ncbi:MAG: peptidoglycan-binding protein [bacterium]
MNINIKEISKKIEVIRINKIIEIIIAFFVIAFLCLSPADSLAGVKGYMIVKDNESFWDPNKDVSITWQIKQWLTDENARIENTMEKDIVHLIDVSKEKIYKLNYQDRTYRIVEFPEEKKFYIDSQKMDQEKKCGEWSCYGIKINIKSTEISFKIECWLSKDVDIPSENREKIGKFLGEYQIILSKELAKYEGYPVQTVLSIKAHDKEIKIVSTVVDFKKMDIDAKLFEIPNDFKAVDDSTRKIYKEDKDEDPNIKDSPIKEEKSVAQDIKCVTGKVTESYQQVRSLGVFADGSQIPMNQEATCFFKLDSETTCEFYFPGDNEKLKTSLTLATKLKRPVTVFYYPGADGQEGLVTKIIFPELEGKSIFTDDNQDMIRKAQIKLQELGYNPGKADGIFGRRTKAAIMKFQKDSDLDVSGELDQDTLKKLQLSN